MKKTGGIFLIVFIIPFVTIGNDKKAPPNFGLPIAIDTPLRLAGTFGEPRMNHYHAGIDIRTYSKEGFPILSVEDGYISRVKVSSGGYGKALYITHPNGYTSVYAHLSIYNPTLHAWVKKRQYEQESYNIELFPDAAQFRIKKGDTIGFSGNSGSSSGPHLHFELRESKTEKPVNPLLFDFKVEDLIRPIAYSVTIYPLNNKTTIDGRQEKLTLDLYKKNDSVFIVRHIPIIHGMVGFSVHAFDQQSGSPNHNGLFSLEAMIDSQRIFYYDVSSFSFYETRYVHAHIDYEARAIQKKQYVHRTFKLPGDRSSLNKICLNNGCYTFASDEQKEIQLILKDAHHNTSYVQFLIKGTEVVPDIPKPKLGSKKHVFFPYMKSNQFDTTDLKIYFPKESFYDDVYFEYKKESTDNPNILSDIHHLHQVSEPVHKRFTISIAPKNVPKGFENKLYIAYRDYDDDWLPISSQYKNGYVTGKSREFGPYFVQLDTIKPTIKLLNIHDLKDISAQRTIQVKIQDNESGIESYRATVDGNWILMEYDAKNDLLTYFLDEKISQGEHQLRITVVDEKENSNFIQINFKR